MSPLSEEQFERTKIMFPSGVGVGELRNILAHIGKKVPAKTMEVEGRFIGNLELLADKSRLEEGINYEALLMYRERSVGTDFDILKNYSHNDRSAPYVGLKLRATETTFKPYNSRVLELLEEIRGVVVGYFGEP
jgi:hypothetical protein